MNLKDQQFQFHDFPGLENEIFKFHDFPGFPWPVWTLIEINFQILVLWQLLSEFCWGVTFRWNCFVNEHAPSFLLVLVNAQGFAQNGWNRHLQISPNTPFLPPKFCKRTVFIDFAQDHCNTQKKLQTTVMQSFVSKQGVLWEMFKWQMSNFRIDWYIKEDLQY